MIAGGRKLILACVLVLLTAGRAHALSNDLPQPLKASAPGRCMGCVALVITSEEDNLLRYEDVVAALQSDGYQVTDFHLKTIIDLESQLNHFFQIARSTTAQNLLILYDGPLVLQEETLALPGKLTAGQGSAIGGVPVRAIVDRVAGLQASSAVIALNALNSKGALADFDLSELRPVIADGPEIVLLAPTASADRFYILSLLSDALQIGLRRWDRNTDGKISLDELAPSREAPMRAVLFPGRHAGQPTPGGTGPGSANQSAKANLLDWDNLYRYRLARTWKGIRKSGEFNQLNNFFLDTCTSDSWPDVCDEIRLEVAYAKKQLKAGILDCHRFTTDLDDPDTSDPGVPFEALDGNEAQAACYTALRAEPDNMRLRFQFGRALEKLGIPDFLKEYSEAAEAGYTVAQYRYGQVLLERGIRTGSPAELADGTAWIEKAAESGLVQAQLLMAELLIHGVGAPQKPEAAKQWLIKAAEHSADGKLMLAEYLHERTRSGPDYQNIAIILDSLEINHHLENESQSNRIAALRRAIEPHLPQYKEKLTMEECASLLNYDPLALLGYRHETSLSTKEVMSKQKLRIRQWMRQYPPRTIIGKCDEPLQQFSASPELTARYAFLLQMVEQEGRDYRQKGNFRELLERSAGEGDLVGMFLFGQMLRKEANEYEVDRYVNGMAWLEKASQKGLAEATFFLAYAHLVSPDFPGFRKQPEKGLRLFNRIRTLNIPYVAYLLHVIYSDPVRFGLPETYHDLQRSERFAGEARALGVEMKGN